jgi:hypothetical protein
MCDCGRSREAAEECRGSIHIFLKMKENAIVCFLCLLCGRL